MNNNANGGLRISRPTIRPNRDRRVGRVILNAPGRPGPSQQFFDAGEQRIKVGPETLPPVARRFPVKLQRDALAFTHPFQALPRVGRAGGGRDQHDVPAAFRGKIVEDVALELRRQLRTVDERGDLLLYHTERGSRLKLPIQTRRWSNTMTFAWSDESAERGANHRLMPGGNGVCILYSWISTPA